MLERSGMYRFGASVYHQTNGYQNDRDELSVVAYTELELPAHLSLRGEFFHQQREDLDEPIQNGYALLRYGIHGVPNTHITYRFDLGLDERRGGGQEHQTHNLNISWKPSLAVRVVAEVNQHQFTDASKDDYQSAALWLGASF